MRPEDLLDQVRDRESFLAFARALADERAEAEKIEAANPQIYICDGALGWMNGDITSFIHAGLYYFEPSQFTPSVENPTWKDIAKFLYCGKIIE